MLYAVLCEGDSEAVVAGGATNEGSAGSGEAGLCLGTAESLTGSGERRLCVAAAVVGGNGVGTRDATGEAAFLAGESGVGPEILGVAGPPQAAKASAKPKVTATASGNRFTKASRYVESNRHPAAKAGKMVSLKAANSRWG